MQSLTITHPQQSATEGEHNSAPKEKCTMNRRSMVDALCLSEKIAAFMTIQLYMWQQKSILGLCLVCT
jgi:hypothetical protein